MKAWQMMWWRKIDNVMKRSYKGRKHKGDGEKLQSTRQSKLILEHKTMHKTCKVQGDKENLCTFNHLVVLCWSSLVSRKDEIP
jgi:hypothetical protein